MATKQQASKPAAKKGAPLKAIAGGKAPATTKAPAKKAAAAPSKPGPSPTLKRGSDNEATIQKIADLRGEGRKLNEITKILGMSMSKVQFLSRVGEARAKGVKKPSADAVRKDRDEKKMSWDAIAVQYGLNKAQAQRLYKDAGGNPHLSVIGKGGRYFSYEDSTAKARSKASTDRKSEPAPKATKKAATPKASPASSNGTPLFTDESSKDEVIAGTNGKTLTVKLSGGGEKKFKVKPGSVSYGAAKGVKSIRFFEVGTGAARTIAVGAIVGAS